MKSFTEYIELKEEEIYAEQMLNEDPLTVAGLILGYAGAGLVIGWGGALIITGYAKLTSRFVSGIRKAYKRFFKKDKSVGDITKSIHGLKGDTKVKLQQNKMKDEDNKYADEFKEVSAAIKNKDADIAKVKIKSVKLDGKLINRMVILEATRAFSEPPLHFGNTGNDCYLFIKKVLGIKTAQAASTVVKKALESKGSELVQSVEKDEKK